LGVDLFVRAAEFEPRILIWRGFRLVSESAVILVSLGSLTGTVGL
jgi:hypothetical protein